MTENDPKLDFDCCRVTPQFNLPQCISSTAALGRPVPLISLSQSESSCTGTQTHRWVRLSALCCVLWLCVVMGGANRCRWSSPCRPYCLAERRQQQQQQLPPLVLSHWIVEPHRQHFTFLTLLCVWFHRPHNILSKLVELRGRTLVAWRVQTQKMKKKIFIWMFLINVTTIRG